MASVQQPPAVQHPSVGGMPRINQAQVQEMYMKFQQMKKSGVPQNDPEFIKTSQFLMKVQQQQQLFQQSQQQPPLQFRNVHNGAVNGVQTSQQPQRPLSQAAVPPSSAGVASAAQPSTSSPSTSAASQFTPNQLALLRQQIQAFKLLGKNAGVPYQMQQALNAQRQRRQAVAEQSTHPHSNSSTAATASTSDAPKAGSSLPNGEAESEVATAPKGKTYKTVQSPYENHVRKEISYYDHTQRKHRLLIPSIFPTGVDLEQVRHEREISIFNRMKARYAELKAVPGNIAHWDSTKETLEPDDTVKRKAIIELKSLGLYARQRAMREKIGRQMMHYDNLAMTTNRSQYRRVKKQNVREARITEKLEKQQRDARENRERKKHSDFLQSVWQHRSEISSAASAAKNKMSKIGRAMYAHHFNIEKEEQKRIERTAKQRLQALKADDEEAYLKLLDQAKDTRITHLLRQTDGFLKQLASSVKAQQRRALERYGDDDDDEDFPEEEASEDEDEGAGRKIDYYAVAHRIREEVTEQANILVGGTLKEYQIKGLQWMISLYNNNLNGILADEMGLGKTIQTISLITYLIERKQQPGPYLVIVPLSTLTNWNLEFEKWAPSVNRIVYKGPPLARKALQDKIRVGRFQVLLTTYEYIIKDRPILSKIKWFHMIIDEGHRMKNTQSKLSATISQYYSTRFRLILTGTPLQNNLGELWAMLNFVLPNIFKSVKTFDEWFNTPFANTGGQDKMELNEEEQILVIRRLHKVLRPFLLRRLKKDVEKDLPDKTEKVIKVKFSALQSRLYKQMTTTQKIAVSDGKGGKTGSRGLSNMIMQLRKLCNHPFVFGEVENQMNPQNTSNDTLWRSAGKFELLDRILPKYQATGHRVLMFFQMTAIMDIMEDFLRYRDIKYMRLDGTTKSEDRSDLLKQFNAPNSEYFIFLLSTRAGGLGLNLQTADTVIIYDSDWNPHQDLQAQDRAHRIGQKNEVRILRLISSNSVEEKILERARYKLDMDGKVIQAGRFDNKSSETDRDAMLRTILESADMAEAGDQDDMDDEELNMILARSDDEIVTFQELDQIRSRDLNYGTMPGSKRIPRLMADAELPDIYINEENPEADEPEEVLGRGARERTRVKYDDGLTEEQWLEAVDNDDDSPEAAAARKQARKDKREQNRMKRASVLNTSGANSPSASRASSEGVETPPKKRGRKPGIKNEKRKAEDDDGEPPAKKRRGPQGRAKPTPGNLIESRVPAEVRPVLQKTLRNLYDSLMAMDVDIPPEEQVEDDEDDEPAKRLIIGPFIKLPSRRDYGDYFMIIPNPICMNQINTKIKKEEYSSIDDMRKDITLMCNNCRRYNEDGSLLYADANAIENSFNDKAQEELNDHPQLAELEGSSGKDSSTAPTTSAGTPQPSASATRIKLVTNGTGQANGGATGMQSDGE
ncbi:SNF2-family ATP dependent chromatin remodeling factor snf21 [Xylariaceae sp. FL0804]|nr:SNF2-family ATP dependent chromatin remodeling factor snf21 [Xylariaceae sp. FL0804]